MTATEYVISFWGEHYALKLDTDDGFKSEQTKIQWTADCKRINIFLCEWYPNKAVTKKKKIIEIMVTKSEVSHDE